MLAHPRNRISVSGRPQKQNRIPFSWRVCGGACATASPIRTATSPSCDQWHSVDSLVGHCVSSGFGLLTAWRGRQLVRGVAINHSNRSAFYVGPQHCLGRLRRHFLSAKPAVASHHCGRRSISTASMTHERSPALALRTYAMFDSVAVVEHNSTSSLLRQCLCFLVRDFCSCGAASIAASMRAQSVGRTAGSNRHRAR